MKNDHLDTNTSFQTFMPFSGASFINDCLLSPCQSSTCFSSLTSRILF